MLLNDVLLEIEIFYLDVTRRSVAWRTLVYVCYRWRAVVFALPHGLNLRLHYTSRASLRRTLEIGQTCPLCEGIMI